MNRKRPHFMTFGPPIPNVSLRDFTKRDFTHEQLAQMWSICGPSVERNMLNLELWQVITMAYIEGLAHGSSIMAERAADLEPHKAGPVDLRGIDC